MTDTTDYASFRQRLDAILRSRDVRQVRAFLIEEGQWSLEQPADPEYAMWLMIAGAPTLKDLHAQARQWLVEHGHGEAAEAVLGRKQASNQNGKKTGKTKPGAQKRTGGAANRASAPGAGKSAAKTPRNQKSLGE
jgi:hypothetical protein